MNAALLSSNRQDWQTPEWLLEKIRTFSSGPIDLDPCTTADNPTGAARFYTPAEDGLVQSWASEGTVFVNPPYGRELPRWVGRCRRVVRDQLLGEQRVIALIPARPDTRWWHNNVTTATAVCFVKGRLRFRGAPSCAPFPSALVLWDAVESDNTVNHFIDVFSPLGWVVELLRRPRWA